MIDVICSKRLPEDTMRLIELLKRSICTGDFSPFSGRIQTNEGTVYHDIPEEITAEEIITMDWLADNVIGFIPTMDEMEEDAKPIIQVQGVAKAKEPESASE
ncbi:MAG: hypothetical protein IJ733_10785 [Lachnospiraceae bacterium]|nr:hypothetical protein [Lachnospiraceae bacterium]